MGLFKEVKKPVIRRGSSMGAEVNPARPRYVEKTTPCMQSCPSGTDVRDWLVSIAQHPAYGRTSDESFEIAWRKIVERNPFPAVCGRVCQHPCELNCNRKAKDGPLAISRLEQFVGDFGLSRKLRTQPAQSIDAAAPRVAIVGAGPAGLSAAYHLALAGYRVTIFDAALLPGGMMRSQIPRAVIPAEVLDGEIENVLQLGISLQTGYVIGEDIPIEELRRDYSAVFFAVGLQKASQLELKSGADGEAVTIGVLPAESPLICCHEPRSAEPRVLNTVSPAIGQGGMVAAAIIAHFEGLAGTQPQTIRPQVIRGDRMKLAWYPAAPRFAGASSMSDTEAIAEAGRCLSCGMCMDCETCWMYCSKNCFTKLPKGEHYKITLDLCNGCGKCADACPCGYIEMN